MASGIGVVIPSFNCARHLGTALESVLGQTLAVDHIVVVDDGSTDDTARLVKKFGRAVQYLYQPNQGIGAARNTGVDVLDDPYLAFLDADDYWSADKTEHQLPVLAGSAFDAVFGQIREFTHGQPPQATTSGGYSACTLLIRRDSFLQVGGFRRDTRLGEFVDWFARFRDAGLAATSLNRTVLYRRIHQDNSGVRDRAHRADYHRVLKAALDRRRRP